MRIILTTGGSGGHIFPALDVAHELSSKGHDVKFIGAFKDCEDVIKDQGFAYETIRSRGFGSKNPLHFLSALGALCVSFFRARAMLKEYKPDVVIGFGSHSSAAVILASYTRRVPAMIHEQNVKPGVANRYLSGFVKKVAVSFGSSKEYFRSEKVVLTGCPTPIKQNNKDSLQIYSQWSLDPMKKTILVFGGSQGAHKINEVFFETFKNMKSTSTLQVLHITGRGDYEDLNKKYADLSNNVTVFPFLENMADAYQISDLVISRSGALTVTELMLFQKRSILIPYPFAGAHQLENAQILARQNLATIVEEKDLTPKVLQEEIETSLFASALNAPENIDQDIAFLKESSKRVAELALSLA